MKRLLLALVLSIAGFANATIVSGFNGDYAVANWTSSPGTGSIDLTGAPDSISLTSSQEDSLTDPAPTPVFTTFYILFNTSATVQFSWDYDTTDQDPLFDPFGYVLANSVAGLDTGFGQLTLDGGTASQSGSQSVFVQAGQYFGFSTFSDSFGGAATTTINGLRIDDGGTVPEPSSFLLLGLALAAAGAATPRRRAA